MRSKAAALFVAVAIVAAGCGGASSGDGGLSEAIAVQGDWTIEVVNADGSAAHQTEFRNEFLGDAFLAQLLALEDTHDGWQVRISTTELNSVNDAAATAALDVATDELVINATVVAPIDGDVNSVAAYVTGTSGVVESVGDPGVVFSRKIFDVIDRVPVLAGQTVLVEIRYSFD